MFHLTGNQLSGKCKINKYQGAFMFIKWENMKKYDNAQCL